MDLDLLFYVAFNSQGHIATGSLQVEETTAYCTVNHQASASNYQLSNMKRPAQDSNRWPQRLEARTLTATPPSPLLGSWKYSLVGTMSCGKNALSVLRLEKKTLMFLSRYSHTIILSYYLFLLFILFMSLSA